MLLLLLLPLERDLQHLTSCLHPSPPGASSSALPPEKRRSEPEKRQQSGNHPSQAEKRRVWKQRRRPYRSVGCSRRLKSAASVGQRAQSCTTPATDQRYPQGQNRFGAPSLYSRTENVDWQYHPGKTHAGQYLIGGSSDAKQQSQHNGWSHPLHFSSPHPSMQHSHMWNSPCAVGPYLLSAHGASEGDRCRTLPRGITACLSLIISRLTSRFTSLNLGLTFRFLLLSRK